MSNAKNSFRCLITDRALTGYEQFAVGITTGGAFRGTFRPAEVSFENGEVVVRAQTDVVAGRSEVIAAKMSIKDIIDVRITPIRVGDQVRAAAARALVAGGGFALAIIVIVMFAAIRNRGGSFNFGTALAFALFFGLGIGFLFSFLPNLTKLDKNLLQVVLVTSDNQALVMAIESKKKALAVFSAHDLKVSDKTTDERSA